MDFAERLSVLMAERGLNNLKLSKKTGISDRLIGAWKKEESGLHLKSAIIIADFFEVSLDYLAGRSDVREINTKMENSREISENGREMLELYEKLPEREQLLLLGRLSEMTDPLLPPEKKNAPPLSHKRAV